MIRILIADDHELFRKGLARVLADEESFEVVADVGNGERAVELCRDLEPHVVLMDLAMPGIGGLEATRRIITWMGTPAWWCSPRAGKSRIHRRR